MRWLRDDSYVKPNACANLGCFYKCLTQITPCCSPSPCDLIQSYNVKCNSAILDQDSVEP